MTASMSSWLLAASRMGEVVRFHELVHMHVGVTLRGGECRVAEHFLDGTQIGPGIEKMRRESVSETMRGQMLPQTAPLELREKDAMHGTPGEPAAAGVPEESPAPRSRGGELEVQGVQVVGNGLHCLEADGNDSLLVTLAQDPHHAGIEIQVSIIGPREFADPQARGIEELKDSPVPVSPPGCSGLPAAFLKGSQEMESLINTEERWKLHPGFRVGNGLGGICVEETSLLQKTA